MLYNNTMIADDWIDVQFPDEIYKNWERLFIKLKHKPLECLKPIGLQNVLKMYEKRYTSPPFVHPYNLRKLESREKYH